MAKLSRTERRKKELRRRILQVLLLLLFMACVLVFAVGGVISGRQKKAEEKKKKEAEIAAEEEDLSRKRQIIEEADFLAEGYDYDAAIELLEKQRGYDTDTEMINAIARYKAAKTNLESKDVKDVPHLYFQPLIVDPDRALSTNHLTEESVANNNAWMTTVDEFEAIIESMYDNDYVLVSMHDLVTETVDENGVTLISANKDLKLPPGKYPYVLSVDDLSYYHQYARMGFADRLVLDEDGAVKCEYTGSSGETETGDFDVVPILDRFLTEHPDGAYKGARGLICLTGYQGIFGYRTDISYETGENLTDYQESWLHANPDFDREEEVARAQEIADALREEGWEFACHTWGHISLSSDNMDTLRSDQLKWQTRVGSIVGSTDIMAFIPGNDIEDWHPYSYDNDAFAFFKDQGYNLFLCVNSSDKYWVQLQDNSYRMGRIACNGLQMWRNLNGDTRFNVFEDYFDVEDVFDSHRPTPVHQ